MMYVSYYQDKFLGLFLFLIISLLFYPLIGHSEVFNVTNEEELRQALSMAESNGEDDVVNVSSGIYRANGMPFTYTTVENFSLNIIGQGPDSTKILGGDEPSRLLIIQTPQQGIKSIGNITVKNISFEAGYSENENGGGLFIREFGIVTIENCVFKSNSGFSGGAVSVISADELNVTDNNFIGNNAKTVGGGAHLVSAEEVMIGNNLFESNSTSGIEGAAISGGGAIITGNNITIRNNVFNGNQVLRDGNGGGAEIGSRENLTLTNNMFTNNFSGSFGGGADIFAKVATIAENEFYDNTASDVGGGFSIRADNVTISKNIISDNTSLSDVNGGGAAVFIPSNPDITNHASIINNLFKGNSAGGNGGGLSVDTSTQLNVLGEILTITNNTLTLNATSKDGGGIHIYDTSNHENIFGIYNNIAYYNTADGNGNDISIADGIFSNIGLSLNLFNNDFADFYSNCESEPGCQSNINRSNNIALDPLFVDAEAGNVSLQPDSPCIDAGDPNAPNVPDTDIYGNSRVPPPDMGAVEYIVEAANNGGCTLAPAGASTSIPLYMLIPVLILIRRIIKISKG